MPPLHRTIAFSQCRNPPFAISEDLNFNVPCPINKPFYEQPRVPEVLRRQVPDRLILPFEFCRTSAEAHTDASASCRTFQHDRITNLFRGLESFRQRGE